MSAKGKAAYRKHVAARQAALRVCPIHKPWERLTEKQQAEFEPVAAVKAEAKPAPKAKAKAKAKA